VSKLAIDAGVAERQVRLAEAQAQQFAKVIRAISPPTATGPGGATCRPNSYLELDGWRYSAMPGRGDDSITIINR
jgi:hypothetical protein